MHYYGIAQQTYKFPKVLFVTTGDGDGRGTIPDGVVLSLQTFNRLGVSVRLENRSVLLKPEILAKYTILLIPSVTGYHDKPVPASLSYMLEIEMKNITEWVKNGGTLISDVNIGRNTIDGKDRILSKGVLDNESWLLSKCFGVELKEINTEGFSIKDTKLDIWKKKIISKNKWELVPVNSTKKVNVLAKRSIDIISYPAITLNKFGKGNALLLPSFHLLTPKDDGGLSSEDEIIQFYNYIFNIAIGERNHQIFPEPWKDGYTSVYCQTFDDGGNKQQYERMISFVKQNKLPTVFFATPNIDSNIIEKILGEPYVSLQGHSFNHPDFRKLDFHQTENEFLLNREFWNTNFVGFRFPYVSNSFWGMYKLEELGFIYETSIAANNIDFIRGSVVPYNIPIFNDNFYKSLNLLEISQIYRSDWYFYQKVLEREPYTKKQQKIDADKFRTYLFDYHSKVVEPNKGVMVYLGHPMYTFISETTMQALADFLSYIKSRNVWITTLDELAKYRNRLSNLELNISEQQNEVVINMKTDNHSITGLTFKLDKMPQKVIYNETYNIKEIDNNIYLILNVNNKNTVKILY